MDKEKEIVEIKRAIREGMDKKFPIIEEQKQQQEYIRNEHINFISQELGYLIDAGYRRADEVRKKTAKEIFDKIQEKICVFTTKGKSEHYNNGYCQAISDIDKRIQEVAEEYGVEVE